MPVSLKSVCLLSVLVNRKEHTDRKEGDLSSGYSDLCVYAFFAAVSILKMQSDYLSFELRSIKVAMLAVRCGNFYWLSYLLREVEHHRVRART